MRWYGFFNYKEFPLNSYFFLSDFDELQILETLTKCMDSKHVEIKKGACEIVTKMCNSEPDCKEFFTTPEFISKLLDFVYRERDDDFVTKALDALIGSYTKHISQ